MASASKLWPWPRGFGLGLASISLPLWPRGLNITGPFSVMLSPRGQSGPKTKILASASKLWPRPRGFRLGLASISLPDYIIRQEDARPRPIPRGQGQSFEAEAKILASRPLWPRGLNISGPFSVMLSPRGQSGLKTKILASASKIWPRPRGFGLGLASMSLPDYIIRQEDPDQAEAKTSRPRPELRGRGQNFGLGATLASRT